MLAGAFAVVLAAGPARAGMPRQHEATGRETYASPQVQPLALNAAGTRLYVVNTTSHSVTVVNTATNARLLDIEVGMEPASIALRPDGREAWVSNHVSDSVSVIDLDPASPTFHTVIATVSDAEPNGATRFDEPAGIAFASNAKAYVALSSTDRIAVVDVATRAVTGHIQVPAQEPRAIAVAGGRLYVASFESFNQTELSICPNGGAPDQCTLGTDDLADFVVQSPNIPNGDTRIVLDPDVPDRDVFVYDTSDESLVDVVEGVGTLLYGIAAAPSGRAWVTLTDARNDVNGLDSDSLADLDNRMFLNEVAFLDCTGGGCSYSAGDVVDLESGAPSHANALATPYGIAVSGDESTLVATAAGSSRLFTMSTATRGVLARLDLDAGAPGAFGKQIPKGVVLRSAPGGQPQTAYVLNTLENTVSVVDVSNPAAPVHVQKISVGADPTPAALRNGRVAFANAFASSNGSFSCESCHPDGNTDQLLWRIGGDCVACDRADEVRSTMPVRGLRNTLPLHWDGTLGDPFGGPNGDVGAGGNGGSDCALGPIGDPERDTACFRALVDASLSGVMCDQQPFCAAGVSGLPGELPVSERDDMARFLAHVAYPPARGRPIDDAVTPSALAGFAQFFVDFKGSGNDLGDLVGVETCADMNSGCHALPLAADTNSSTLGGFDVPTMRGMTDRTLQFSIGITNAEEVLEFAKTPGSFLLPGVPFPIPFSGSPLPYDPAVGLREDVTFAAAFVIFESIYGAGPLDMLQMFEEASTGQSGAIGRQITLSQATTTGPALAATDVLLTQLETADARNLVNLQGQGRRSGQLVQASYRADSNDYLVGGVVLSHAGLLSEAQAGTTVLTLTAFLPANVGKDTHNQPLLSVASTATRSGVANWNPNIPLLPGDNPMTLRGIDVRSDAVILVDGQPAAGTIACVNGGSFAPYCTSERIRITLASPPTSTGPHLLQVQNPKGPLSNEMPICVGAASACNN